MSIDVNKNIEPKGNVARLKAENERNLSSFASYGINPESLQKVMVDLGQDLGTFGPKGDGVDGDLGKKSLISIGKIQKSLNLKVTGVVDFALLTYLFPRTFRTFNKKENGRTIEDTKEYVREKVLGEKKEVKLDSKKQRLALLNDIKPLKSDKIINHIKVKEKEQNLSLGGIKLAKFLEKKGFPRYVSGASCGANVGNALINFGIKGLPRAGRDGYKWSGFLDGNENFVKQRITNAGDAQPGGILVYDKGYGRTQARQKYGHVEIKTADNSYYYGGQPKKYPGGSSRSGFTGYVYYPKFA